MTEVATKDDGRAAEEAFERGRRASARRSKLVLLEYELQKTATPDIRDEIAREIKEVRTSS